MNRGQQVLLVLDRGNMQIIAGDIIVVIVPYLITSIRQIFSSVNNSKESTINSIEPQFN